MLSLSRKTKSNFQDYYQQLSILQILELQMLADFIAIFLSLFGFTQQLLLFKKQRHTGSFSIFMTAVPIHASILKIFFYFISPYKTSIFIQNFLIISLHLLITKEYVDINSSKITVKTGYYTNFWQWKTFKDYLIHLLGLAVVLALITFGSIKLKYRIVGEIFGLLATLIEIILAFPQIIKCFQQKSSKGVSKKMIAIWLCSDIYKTIYFITHAQPLQFIATGIIQTFTDVTLGIQMWIYRQKQQRPFKEQ